MKPENIKTMLDENLSELKFNEQQRTKVREQMKTDEKREGGGRKRRRATILVAACLCVVFFTGVCFAVELPQRIAAEIKMMLEPIEESSVYDGIELKTIGAVCDNDTIKVYFTMRDLYGKGITEDTGIYTFDLAGTSILGCYRVDYNEETGTGTWCLEGDIGRNMKSKKLTLSVTQLQEGGNKMIASETKIPIYEILAGQEMNGTTPMFQTYENAYNHWNAQNSAGADIQGEMNDENSILLLPEGNLNLSVPGVDWITIDNIAYENGWLHIKAEKDREKSAYNYGYFYVADQNTNTLPNAVLNKPFIDSGQEEYIIKVDTLDDLKNMQLMGSFTDSEGLKEGEWQVTFKLKGVDTKETNGNIEVQGYEFYRVEVSTLGVTLEGNRIQMKTTEGNIGSANDMAQIEVSVEMKDGTIKECDGGRSQLMDENDKFIGKWKFNDADSFNVEDVQRVIVNGKEFVIR